MKKLAAISALVTALLVCLVAAPASSQSKPPKKATCDVSDSSVSPGDQITVSGRHWQAGSTVTITLQPEGITLGTATVGTNHKFSVVVTIPENISPGPHTIVCSGTNVRGNAVSIVSGIQILAIVSGGGAAFTGTTLNLPLWMVLIAALFAVGVVLVLLSRRRGRRGVSPGS